MNPYNNENLSGICTIHNKCVKKFIKTTILKKND